MRRILFSCCGLIVYSYPAMLYLGLVTGTLAGAYVAQSAGLDANRFGLAMMLLLIPALIGSRLLFVLMRWDVYAREPRRIWRRSEGGMAMYGGLLLAVPLSTLLIPALGLPFGLFWDTATITILIGMIFTRVGCLLNGCCSGRPTAAWFGLNLPDHRGVWQRRIPTQLLEMGWAAILLAAVLVARGRALFPGAIFCSAVIAYGAGRYFLETLRDDRSPDRPVLRALSLALAAGAFAAFVFAWPS
jgi:phosphatidylglycerol:prolipoprotein diacylglycerol transferase